MRSAVPPIMIDTSAIARITCSRESRSCSRCCEVLSRIRQMTHGPDGGLRPGQRAYPHHAGMPTLHPTLIRGGTHMFRIPLHPLVVHFPVVLAILLPISAVVALLVIRKGATPRRVWSVPVAVAAALALSAWVATETGESQEDRVERVVARGAL